MANIVEDDQCHNHIPNYAVTMDDDMVIFRNRNTMPKTASLSEMKSAYAPSLSPETYNDARIVAPAYDVYWLQPEWRNRITEVPRDADGCLRLSGADFVKYHFLDRDIPIPRKQPMLRNGDLALIADGARKTRMLRLRRKAYRIRLESSQNIGTPQFVEQVLVIGVVISLMRFS